MLELVNRLGPPRIAAMGAVTLALIGFFAFIMMRVSTPGMAVLFTDLGYQDSSAILKDLDGRGIKYEIRQDGATILVPKDDALRLRLDLAGKGMPAGGSIGYELFDKSDAFSASSFVQNINQLRAMEGELARTIRALDRVQNARVHLAIPERKLFQRDKEEPRASIVLKIRGDLDAGQVRAIRHLVATAVEGLKPERVSIVDETGRLLADGAGNTNDLAVLGAEKQAAFEKRLQAQVEDIVANIVGRGRARVQVAAEMDFNRIQETSDAFDPDGRVVRSTQTRTEQQQSQDSKDGQVTVGNELPAANQQQRGQNQNQPPVTRDQTQKNEEIVNYEISRKTRTETIEAGRVKRLSVAVLVDGAYAKGANGEVAYAPRAPEELDRIAALVRSAIGFDKARGDQIEVVNLRFADGPPVSALAEQPGVVERLLSFGKDDILRLVELGVFAALTLMVLAMVVRPLVRQIRAPLPGVAGPAGALVGPDGTPLALPPGAPGQLVVTEGGQLIQPGSFDQIAQQLPAGHMQRIGEMVKASPGESTAIIRSWLNNPR